MRTELVTSLKRTATEIVAELESEPVLITQHGKPAAYLMAVEVYDALSRRVGVLEGIARKSGAFFPGVFPTGSSSSFRMTP